MTARAAVRAAVFDLDGTLIDSAPDLHGVGVRVLAEVGGAPVDFATAKGFIGHGAAVFVARLRAAAGLPDDPALQARMLARYLELYEDAHGLTQVYPGAAAALETLARAGWRLGVCTNKPLGPARATLRHFGLDGLFSVVIGGDSLPQRKPDPAPLRAAVAALGAPRALFVGDSEIDAETARAAALPFALFTEGYRKTPAEALPQAGRFARFDDLPALAGHLLA